MTRNVGDKASITAFDPSVETPAHNAAMNTPSPGTKEGGPLSGGQGTGYSQGRQVRAEGPRVLAGFGSGIFRDVLPPESMAEVGGNMRVSYDSGTLQALDNTRLEELINDPLSWRPGNGDTELLLQAMLP